MDITEPKTNVTETSRQRLDRMVNEASQLADNKRRPASIKVLRDGPMFTVKTSRETSRESS